MGADAIRRYAAEAARLGRAGLRRAWHGAQREIEALHDRRWTSYGGRGSLAPDVPQVLEPPSLPSGAAARALAAVCEHYLAHRFDVLGSGWASAGHGTTCQGFLGHRFPPGPTVAADPNGRWLRGRVTVPNLSRSREIWGLVTDGYDPIDWQLDLRSGFRWDGSARLSTISVGAPAGADIKVPWELARLQHLPQLALASLCARAGTPGFRPAGDYAREVVNQLCDFVATNPPRFGVNWTSPMDVAIRAVNMAVAVDLLGAAEDWPGEAAAPGFPTAIVGSLLDHVRHVARHLDWSLGFRGNHYLAEIVGLVIVARHLPATLETNTWLAFAVDELVAETESQFLDDGGTIEASTSYHRLSTELVLYGTAAAAGIDRERRALLAGAERRLWRSTPGIPGVTSARRAGRPGYWTRRGILDLDDHVRRVLGAVWFSNLIARDDGHVPQVGDNDSGRLLKLDPAWLALPADGASALGLLTQPDRAGICWIEDTLDHRHLARAASGVFKGSPRPPGGGPTEAAVLSSFAGGQVSTQPRPVASPEMPPPRWEDDWDALAARGSHVIHEVVIDGGGLPVGPAATVTRLPDFGLVVFRSPNLYLAVRCGTDSLVAPAPHAHNDQLSFELDLGGRSLVADPGSFVYTADPAVRDQYRAAAAHSTPIASDDDLGRLDLGLFVLDVTARAAVLWAGPDGFVGEVAARRGRFLRHIALQPGAVVVTDLVPVAGPVPAGRAAADRQAQRDELSAADLEAGTHPWSSGPAGSPAGSPAYSPGYGLRLADGVPPSAWSRLAGQVAVGGSGDGGAEDDGPAGGIAPSSSR